MNNDEHEDHMGEMQNAIWSWTISIRRTKWETVADIKREDERDGNVLQNLYTMIKIEFQCYLHIIHIVSHYDVQNLLKDC